MSRTKTYVQKPASVVGDARKGSTPRSGGRLLQLAPMPGAVSAPMPKRAATQARTNLTAEPVAAVIVPQGASVSQGSLDVVAAGESIPAPGGSRVAGFIHADGTAVQFIGDGGGVYLSAALANREFGPLLPAARKMLQSNGPAKPAQTLHRRVESTAPVSSTTAVDNALKSSASQPLPTRNRNRLESSFGSSLSGVRVHTDSAADRAAESVQAKAFTTGQDVYFRAGQFQPGSATGDHLLAHEVAHTVQQGNSSGGISLKAEQNDWQVSQPSDYHEREADRAADAAVSGNRAAITNLAASPVLPTLARRTDAPGPGTAPPTAAPPSTAPAAAPAAKAKPTGTPAAGAAAPGGSAQPAGPAPATAGGDSAVAAPLPGKAEAKSAPTKKEELPTTKPEAAPGEKGTANAESKAEGTEGGDSGAGLAAVVAEVSTVGQDQQEHPPVAAVASDTQKAADVTPEEAAGKAQGAQLGQMAAQKQGPFNREKFKASLRAKITAMQADDAKGIKDGDKAQGVNDVVKSGVAEEKKAAAGPINDVAKQAPATGEPKPGEKLPETAAGAVPKVDGAKAVPAPVSDDRKSVAAESQAFDQKMADAKVTPEQLQKANEPAFQAAADSHATAKTEADALPAKANVAEATVLDASRAQAGQATQAGLSQMQGQRAEKLAGSKDEQTAGKAKYEATRKRISDQLGGIYEETKKSVDTRMATLDKDVEKTFDDGASTAKNWFYAYLAKELLIHYATGGWLVDAFTGEDSKEKIFAEGRSRYLADMEVVIDQVAGVVEQGLNDVVAIIDAGRVRLEAAIKQFGPEDAKVAEEVAGGLREQFASLEKSVEDKQTELVDSLAKKFVAAQKDVDSTINALRDPVGALISMAIDAVSGVIETIMKMKDLLMSALSKAGEAIDLILSDPIAFLGYLVAGVKQGVQGFLSNIGTYLQKGLLDWLFGALAQAGIQMPEKFDLSGLMSIVLQVLGLTWTNIRKRAVAIVGEPVVKALETGSEIIMTLISKGAAGLWEYIKEQAAALMETLKEGVKSFIMESVIVAGVKWLIGLLNPASAFVKACMAIYDIVTFIINKGQQILSFVNAVLDSVLSIAKGDIVPAAKAVEGALAKAIPVAIGFLASLLGVGDLGEKIKKVIDKIQAPINKVIDWLIKKAVGLVKAIGKALGIGGKEDKKSGASALPDGEVKVNLAMAGESHTLTARVQGGVLQVRMASGLEVEIAAAIDDALEEVNKMDDDVPDKSRILSYLQQLKKDTDRNSILQDHAIQNDDQAKVTFPAEYLARRLGKAARDLIQLGDATGLKSLTAFANRMRRVRLLPSGYKARERLYERGAQNAGKSYDTAINEVRDRDFPLLQEDVKNAVSQSNDDPWSKLKSEKRVPPWATKAGFKPKDVNASNYDVDHLQSLAEHWIAVGRLERDEPRWQAATNTTQMKAIPKEFNRSNGSNGAEYQRDVGPEFKSIFAEGGRPGAKKIDGEPFGDVTEGK